MSVPPASVVHGREDGVVLGVRWKRVVAIRRTISFAVQLGLQSDVTLAKEM